MIKNNFNNFIEKLRQIEIDSNDDLRVRKNLESYSFEHKLEKKKPIPSPYISWMKSRQFAFAIVLLFMISSMSVAAEGALPGDILYPVKIKFNEPLKLSLASSDESKARLHAQLASRRVEEAEKLASKNKLDAEVSATLARKAKEHLENFHNKVSSIKSGVVAGGIVEEAEKDFEDKVSKLASHGNRSNNKKDKETGYATVMIRTSTSTDEEDEEESDSIDELIEGYQDLEEDLKDIKKEIKDNNAVNLGL